MRMKKTSVG